MGYFYWDGIPRKADDPTRITAFVAAQLALQDELSELADVNIPAPADGEVLTWDTGTSRWIASAVAGVGDLSRARYWRTGRYHQSPLISYNAPHTTVPISANFIYVMAFPIPLQMTFDRIGLFINTGSAGSARLGIYDDDGNSYPNSLVVDAGIIDVTGAGFKVLSISEVLSPGLYWLAWLSDSTPSPRMTNYHVDTNPIGSDDGEHFGCQWSVAQAYGALPANYPGGGARTLYAHILCLRRSA